jgi:hypothetical protein
MQLTFALDKAEGTKVTTRTAARLGGFVGFIGGFLMAYQRSSGTPLSLLISSSSQILMIPPARFWGWAENEREEKKDLAELSARAAQGLPLYGSSDQPAWVQHAAYRNSAFSQLKFGESSSLCPFWILSGLCADCSGSCFPMVQPGRPPPPWYRPCQVRREAGDYRFIEHVRQCLHNLHYFFFNLGEWLSRVSEYSVQPSVYFRL